MENRTTLFFLLGVLLIFNTCHKEDLCKNQNCYPGTCVNGICDCPAGYETDEDGRCIESVCVGINCVHGQCVNGQCTCDAGYERDANGHCTVVSRDKLIGAYSVSKACPETGSAFYNTSIVAGDNIYQLKIKNFDGYSNVIGTIYTKSDSLYIDISHSAHSSSINATGVYSQNTTGKPTITFTYWHYVFDGVSWLPVIVESCHSVFVHQ
ncbi:MAG: hypothetical protein JNJ57_02930 [Saprospiraceae bacterium]|nr:hypothetical protein [Saprospiraceae bacterium]